MPGQNVASWGAQSVRSALFTSAYDSARVDEVFEKAFGQAPSDYRGAPAGVPFTSSVASSLIKAGQVTAQKVQGRIDLVLTPSAGSPRFALDNTPTLFTIRDLNEGLNSIQEGVIALGNSLDSIARASLIVELGVPATTVVEANKLILDVIPFDIPLTSELDFVLQFDVQIVAKKLVDITINRLCRWSVNQVQQITIPNPMFSVQSVVAQNVSTFYTAQMTLDVNTVPSARIFSGQEMRPILTELRAEIDAVRRGVADQG